MKILKFIFFLSCIVMFIHCNTHSKVKVDSITNDSAINKPETNFNKAKNNNSLKLLENFTELPSNLDGCTCAYSETEEKYKKNEFLFVSNTDSTGYISIQNKLIKLTLENTILKKNNKNYIDIYSNDQYKVSLNIRYLKSTGEETYMNVGTIIIEDIGMVKESKEFVGECGC